MKPEMQEAGRVVTVGVLGWIATIKLADVATLVSIAVGVATFSYIVAKIYYLVKTGGKSPE